MNPATHQSFTWEIDAELMNKVKEARPLQQFMSPIYHNMWCLTLVPNYDDMAMVELQLCAMPNDMQKFMIIWNVNIAQCDYDDGWRSEFEQEVLDLVVMSFHLMN